MSRRVQLPTEADVKTALTQLCDHADQQHTRPTVTALARRVGLTNSTFWRYFPQQAKELVERTRTKPAANTTHFGDPGIEHRIARLTRDNQCLREHLDLATANIVRLAIENHDLRSALETAAGIIPLGRKQS